MCPAALWSPLLWGKWNTALSKLSCNYIWFSGLFLHSPFWNASLQETQEYKEDKRASFKANYYCDQYGTTLHYLHKMLSPLRQNIASRKRVNLPCLHLTSPELFQIGLHYVCNLYCVHYVHNIKILSVLSSWLWRNKTPVCNSYLSLVCSSALGFLMLGCVPGVTISC